MSARWRLVRHGATEWSDTGRYAGHSDVPLSDRGREQARALAARLKGECIDVAYTSDLRRATETLAIVLDGRVHEGMRPPVVHCPELRELDFGAWEGRTYAELAGEPGAAAVLRGDMAPPGGESLAQLGERIAAFVERLKRTSPQRHKDTMSCEGADAYNSAITGNCSEATAALTPSAPLRAGSALSQEERGRRRDTHQKREGSTHTVLVVAHGGSLRAMLCSLLGLPVEAHWRFQVEPGSLSEVVWDAETGARLVRLNDCCHLEAVSGQRSAFSSSTRPVENRRKLTAES